jgi:hypothetical protein
MARCEAAGCGDPERRSLMAKTSKSPSAKARKKKLEADRRPEPVRALPAATPAEVLGGVYEMHSRTPGFANGSYPYAKKMKLGDYETEKHLLQIELLKMQTWVKATGQRVVILFEGRDAAGKGGAIKRFMEHLNPRGCTTSDRRVRFHRRSADI